MVIVAGVTWVGSAHVDVMIWESGGEHPYHSAFELAYDQRPNVTGKGWRLVPRRVRVVVEHEVRGLLSCTGNGEELVKNVREGAIGADGTYQLELPRAIGAFACGKNVTNKTDRRVSIGTGLFNADAEMEDSDTRTLEAGGLNMEGSYTRRQKRQYDASERGVIEYEFRVRWNLARREGREVR
jgi:hypothetical protein